MKTAAINITAAEQLGDYTLRLTFDDGSVQSVDFNPFLSLSRHPDIRTYLDPVRFAAFRIEFGDLIWGDHDLCFPIMDLYHNRLNQETTLQAVA